MEQATCFKENDRLRGGPAKLLPPLPAQPRPQLLKVYRVTRNKALCSVSHRA